METDKKIFDTHAHYNDEKFKNNQDEIINYVHNNGVEKICNVGTSLEESKEAIELSQKYGFIFSSVGIHPFNVNSLNSNWEEEILNLAKNKKVVAIGEAGLDYTAKEFSKNEQFDVFEKQLNLSKILKLPVIIHSREAEEDTLAILKNFPDVKGVIHCFSGDYELAEKYVDLGWFIGFTGVITFKNGEKTRKAAFAVPNEKIVVETDCPYMAPVPFRGQVCNSAMLTSIIEKIAEIKNMSYDEILNQTNLNAHNLYKIKI